ncbi:MAG: hypothetical protein WBZ19_03260, partial [Chthoniobacterales bacterium]
MPFSLGYRLLVTGSCHSKVTGILSQQGHKGAKTEQVQKKAFFEIHYLSQSFCLCGLCDLAVNYSVSLLRSKNSLIMISTQSSRSWVRSSEL